MPLITAILHTHNDELRLGRALQTLIACDEILIVDHGSIDGTLRIAREYGARIHRAGSSGSIHPLAIVRHEWVLALLPSESVGEPLEAALFEWKLLPPPDFARDSAFSIPVREQTEQGWVTLAPATRLVPRAWSHWRGSLPHNLQRADVLAGELLRFRHP